MGAAIFELVRAKKIIVELEKQVAQLTIPPPPYVGRLMTPLAEVENQFRLAGIGRFAGTMDAPEYYHPSLVGWMDVISYIYSTQELPRYSIDSLGRWNVDCEDFAIWFKAMVSIHFGFNHCHITIGIMPRGRHGFNLLGTEQGLKVFEPQPGFDINHPFDIGDENRYFPKEALG